MAGFGVLRSGLLRGVTADGARRIAGTTKYPAFHGEPAALAARRGDGVVRLARGVDRHHTLPVFGRHWDIHALIAGALLAIVGTQLVALDRQPSA